MNGNSVITILFVASVAVVSTGSASAQTAPPSSLNDGMTPSAVTPGSPDGSYPLTGFESVNLFNGNLSFHLPLLTIGGRGEAQYTMYLGPQMDRRWQFRQLLDADANLVEYVANTNMVPESYWWGNEGPPPYSPGILVARRSAGAVFSGCQPNQTAIVDAVLTRLTFISGDGTEYDLVDNSTGGATKVVNSGSCGGALTIARDSVFVTRDGSAATFVSDSMIYDWINAGYGNFSYPSGWLLFRNGVRYRIDNGLVSSIQDRNGNQIQLAYNTIDGYALKVTDQLNRVVTVTSTTTGGNGSPNTATGGSDVIAFKGFGGAPRSITVNLARMATALGNDLQSGSPYGEQSPSDLWGMNCGGLDCGGSGTIFDPLIVSSVVLPNSTAQSPRQYQFKYNGFGELVDILLPTGGEYRYEIGPGYGSGSVTMTGDTNNAYGNPVEVRRVLRRDALITGATQERTVYSVAYGPTVVTVDHQDAGGNSLAQDSHSFYEDPTVPSDGGEIPYAVWDTAREYQTDERTAGGANVIRRTVNVWQQRTCGSGEHCLSNGSAVDPRLTSATVSLNDVSPNLISEQTYTYDQYNNRTGVTEFDFGSGAAGAQVRSTATTYYTNGYDTDNSIHLRNLPASVTVNESNGSVHSYTGYEYDNYTPDSGNHAALITLGDATGLVAIPSAVSQNTRGNVTAFSRGQNAGTVVATNYFQYDSAGNVLLSRDPNGNATTASYSDAYGTPDGSAVGNTPPVQVGSLATHAFPTLITNALNQLVNRQYDYYLGKEVDATDVNGVVSSFYYSYPSNGLSSGGDMLDRLAQTIRAAGVSGVASSTLFTYDDTNLTITANSDQTSLNDKTLQTLTKFDGLGRTVESRVYTSPSTYLSTQTRYDALSRVWQVSNPGDPSNWTVTTYDPLNRVQTTMSPDLSQASNSYAGNRITSADAACKVRTTTYDALGRLSSILEDPVTPSPAVFSACSQSPAPPSRVNGTTSYTYDVADHLTGTTQGTVQARTFMYDSLGRLISAANPETGGTAGTIGYQYDNNGNLKEKDTYNGNATKYLYDALNRVVSKTFYGPLAGATPPNVTYCYDGNTSTAGCSGAPTGSYMRGRPTMVKNPNSATLYTAYDALGHVTGSGQQTAGMTPANPALSYTYDLAGEMTSMTFPSGRKVTYGYDPAGRINLVQGVLPSTTNYASNISYAPHGAVMGLQLGNGLWETTNFNSRLQPVTMYLGSMQGGSDVWKLLNTYGTSGQNNGNVTLQQLSLPAPSPGGNPVTVTSAYTYDGVNRLLVAAENPANQTSPVCPDAASQWCTQFGYDVYGNRSIAGRTNFGVSPNEPAAFNAANQITGTGWTYDTVNLRGTITGDPAGDLFAYDAEDRLLSGNGISYLYDGDGRRVGKAPAGGAANPTWYVYDAMGNLAAEYNAPPAEAGTVYLTGDQLGSTRVVTNTVTPGTPSERHDYYPFGEEILTTTASPRYGIAGYAPAVEMPWLFTGKERDSESGLDYFGARYYGSSMGRFMSPDPVFATVNRLMDPQQWNMYSYAGNNPLSNTDPTGLDFNITGCGSTNTTNCSNGTFGTYDSKGQFTATVLSNDANGGLVDKAGNSYSGTFDQSGFHFSNADGSVSGGGQYVDPGTTTTLNGSGVFSGTQGAFNSDCGGSCQGKGSLTDIVPGSIQAAKDAFGLSKEDAFNIFGGHGDALNYRGPDDQDAHIVQHLNTTGKNAGKTELHFEGHPPGRDLVNFVLHQVDAIRDAHNHQSQKEPDLP